ncbi:MAG: permease [Deltaproteobacteria bacterium]|jgi:cell division transport system permease protein|nr:permease [Deltaproteobacteria bacterium]
MMRIVFRLVVQGLRDLGLNPWAQALTLAAVSLVAFLSGLFLMALVTLNHQLSAVRGESVFQVYWRPGMDIAAIKDQWEGFRHVPGFTGIKTFTPEEALRSLSARLGRASRGDGSLARAFPALGEQNPLPATALVTFLPDEEKFDAWLAGVMDYLKRLPGVERVAVTPLRDELGHAWRQISHYVMWPCIGFLCLVLALVVGNTIRLSLVSRAQEVEILRLVGAFTWYIRLPLIVGGAAQGFLGGCFALSLLHFVHAHIKDVLNFPPLLMEIQFLPLEIAALLVLVPTAMGILGSWTAVRE